MKKKNIKLIIGGGIVIVVLLIGVISQEKVLKELGLGNLISNHQDMLGETASTNKVKNIEDPGFNQYMVQCSIKSY